MQRMFSSRRSYVQWHQHLTRKKKINIGRNSELIYRRQNRQVRVDCLPRVVKRSLVFIKWNQGLPLGRVDWALTSRTVYYTYDKYMNQGQKLPVVVFIFDSFSKRPETLLFKSRCITPSLYLGEFLTIKQLIMREGMRWEFELTCTICW